MGCSTKKGALREKTPFSPFPNGGIEIKATCGSVPTPKECVKKGLIKPAMGDTRIDLMKGYDWKAHHRETNNLVGIVWDFDNNRTPRIIGVFLEMTSRKLIGGKLYNPEKEAAELPAYQ